MAKIMIVDDEEDIRISLKNLLEAQGYQVIMAEDGDQCLQLVKKEKPDLILMDILMPGTSVNSILPKLKSFKIIILSVVNLKEKRVSETGKNVPQGNEHSNIIDYVGKPFDSKNLLSKVKKALS